MLNKINKAVLFLIAFCLMVIPLNSWAKESEATEIAEKVIQFKLNESDSASVRSWIDGALTEKAGISSEWYVIALRQQGDYDFLSYQKALIGYLSENQINSASTREKYALALIASGSEERYITEILDNSLGEQGIMSWIYGLHIMNNGYVSQEYSVDSVIDTILAFQLTDGSYALYGENGDVDTTAMAVQALAYYNDNEKVRGTIEKSLDYLSKQQTENGGYISRGVENLESTAQVLVALCSLGIDCKADKRFIKNGNDLFDVIFRYELTDGSFCHKVGGGYNNMATVQAFYSSVAYLRMTDGKSPLYIFEEIPEPPDCSPEFSVESQSQSIIENPTVSSEENKETNKADYKIWVCVSVALTALSVCLVMFIFKKRNKKNFVIVIAVAIIIISVTLLTNFQSVDEYYGNQTSKANVIGKVTISVNCQTVKGLADHIPENGIIIQTEEYEIAEGDTVYNILLEAATKHKIHLETNGNGENIYVEGIGNIYEFDFGDLSGWMFFVNGQEASVSCGEYKPKDGDKIEWVYTCQMGEDLK